MPKSSFVKNGDREFSNQLLQFKAAIPTYSSVIGVSAGQITAHNADADRYKWELDVADSCSQCSQALTAWKFITRNGGSFPATGAPEEVAWPTPEPSAVAPGVEARFRALVKQIKAHANYNPSIGEALGIEGEEQSGPDYGTLKPILKLKASAGGVVVGWTWQGYAAFLKSCEIHVDRGDGEGFQFLTIDTTPGYTDTQAFPATPAKWTYKAVYRDGTARVGQWSDPVSVTVG